MSDIDIDLEEALGGGDARMKTKLPGLEVTTQLAEADPEELERLHRAQLTFALEHAEDAKEASRM
ncbi:hypothetical protein [Natronomonas marina]|jgi:hypothetical protein|uniref:hypothetical protein n=1 Tax=Natronomonas marina TaxID=2961939 RepID=UPI0020C949BA|nr:hypothetical protein [Natronomonas marina]